MRAYDRTRGSWSLQWKASKHIDLPSSDNGTLLLHPVRSKAGFLRTALCFLVLGQLIC